MKINIIVTALAFSSSCLMCQNLHKTDVKTPQQSMDTVKEYTNSGYNWKASHVVDGSNPDSAGTYQIKQAPARVNVPWDKVTAPSTSRRAFLGTGWWKATMAFQASDTAVHHNYIGKSLRFKEDQTFDIMEGANVLETGHWAFDEPNKIMYISCKNTYFNNTWKVHENGFRMVWLGNTDLNVTGIQVRFDDSKTQPGGQ